MLSFKDKCENDSFNQIYFHIWAKTMIYTVQSHAEMDNVLLTNFLILGIMAHKLKIFCGSFVCFFITIRAS